MGMIYVMSTPVSTLATMGTFGGSTANEANHLKRIKVNLLEGGSADSLRFWIMGSDLSPECVLYVYENGELKGIGVEHIVANQAKLLEIDSGGNVANTVAFTSRGMTKDVLESIPESAFKNVGLQFKRAISILISWEQNGASSSAKFPVKSIEITGRRYRGERSMEDSVSEIGKFNLPASHRLIESKTYEFTTPRTIKYTNFEIESSGRYWYPSQPTFSSVSDEENKNQLAAGAILIGCFKKSDGKWSSWRLISESLEDQENVIAMKLQAWLAVTPRVWNALNLSSTQNLPSYEGPVWLKSVTFDRQSAEGTYVGGTFTTKTLHLANEARRVHATLVHKEDLNVKAYVSLRAEGTLVSGENFGTGIGNRVSVTLQHTSGLTNDGFKLYFNGVEQEVSSYSLATSSGLVTYNAPSGVSVTCDYYYNAGVENFVEMTKIATYRNVDKPGMLESQFKYETENGGKVVTLKAEVEGDGKIEQFAVFFNE